MAVFKVVLRGGAPWGFRLKGGSDFNEPLRIAKINPNSKAYNEGVLVGDYVEGLNGYRTQGLPNNDAQQLIRQAGEELTIELYRPKSLNGPVNGDAQNISSVSDDQFYTGGESDTSYRSFNAPPYGSRSRDFTSPSQDSQCSMTITVNSRKVTGSPPASPKYQSSISFLPSSPASSRAFSDRDFDSGKSHSLVEEPSTSTSMFNSSTLGRPRATGPVTQSIDHGYNTVPSKSKGMNLFLKQQEKLSQLGEDIEALTSNLNADFESSKANTPSFTSESFSPVSRQSRASTKPSRPMPVWSLSEDEGASPRPMRKGRNMWQSDTEDAFRSSVDYRLRLGEKKSSPAPLWTGSFSGQKQNNSSAQQPSTAPAWIPRTTGGPSNVSGPIWPEPNTSNISTPAWIPPRPTEPVKPAVTPAWIPPRPDQAVKPSAPQWTPKSPAEQQSRSPQAWPQQQARPQPAWMPKSPEPEKTPFGKQPVGSLDEPQVFDVPIIIQKDNVPIYIQKKKSAPSETKPNSQDNYDSNLRIKPSVSPDNAHNPDPYSAPVSVANNWDSNLRIKPSGLPEHVENSDPYSTPLSVANNYDSNLRIKPSALPDNAENPVPYSAPLSVANENSIDPVPHTFPVSSSTKPAVWNPGSQPQSVISEKGDHQSEEPNLTNVVPVWTPGGATNTIKKEFKPVKLDTLTKSEKPKPPVQKNDPEPTETFAWQPKRSEESTKTPTSTFVYTPLNNGEAPSAGEQQSIDFTSHNGNTETMDSLKSEPSRLPPTQSPYITLLQKSREFKVDRDEYIVPDVPLEMNSYLDGNDPSQVLNIIGSPITVTEDWPSESVPVTTVTEEEGQIPKGAVYLGQQEVIEGDVKHTDEYYAVPQEGEETKTTKVVEQKPKIYPGIGPTDEEGVPLAFRKNVDESKQSDWYKQMFKSLHVTDKKEDDKVDIKLHVQDGNPYKVTYRFPASEDQKSLEARMNALNVSKSRTLPKETPYKPKYEVLSPKERASSLERDKTGPREKATFGKDYRRNEWAPADTKPKSETFKIQPRSIMDYEPGFSSIAFHETKKAKRLSQQLKENEKGVTHNPPIEKPGQFNKYNVSQVRPEVRGGNLDEDGDVRVAYKQIQKGGEIPYKGLQKPAPDKPVGKNYFFLRFFSSLFIAKIVSI